MCEEGPAYLVSGGSLTAIMSPSTMTTSKSIDRGSLWIASSTVLLGAAIIYGIRNIAKLIVSGSKQDPLIFRGKRPAVGTSVGTVDEIHIYPVKSMKACAVQQCGVTAAGLEGDRILMIVNEKGNVVTQRMIPQLSQIQTTYRSTSDTRNDQHKNNSNGQTLTTSITLSLVPSDAQKKTLEQLSFVLSSAIIDTLEAREIRMGSVKILCLDLGDSASRWIREALELLGASSRSYKTTTNLRLVWCQQQRHVTKTMGGLFTENASHFDATHLSDVAPMSLASRSSLQALNTTIQQSHEKRTNPDNDEMEISMNRFRANLLGLFGGSCQGFSNRR